MRVAVILAGVVLGLGGLFVAVIYGFIIEWGCNGSDAGEPPSAGSVGATICESSAFDAVLLALGLATLVVPMVGAVLAARRRRYAPLLGAAAVAAGAVFALGLALHAVEEGSESAELFVGLPLLTCAGLAAVAIRQGRAERRQ
jgi:uncharacterized membrane protein